MVIEIDDGYQHVAGRAEMWQGGGKPVGLASRRNQDKTSTPLCRPLTPAGVIGAKTLCAAGDMELMAPRAAESVPGETNRPAMI